MKGKRGKKGKRERRKERKAHMWLESRYSLIKEGVLALRWTEKPGGWLEREMDGGRGW